MLSYHSCKRLVTNYEYVWFVYTPIFQLYRQEPVLRVLDGRPLLLVLRANVWARSSSCITTCELRDKFNGQGWRVQASETESSPATAVTGGCAGCGLPNSPLLSFTAASEVRAASGTDELCGTAEFPAPPVLDRALFLTTNPPSSCLRATDCLKLVIARSLQPSSPSFSAPSY